MKILIANSFHYERGGDCTYTFALAQLLQSKGHQVIHFATRHPLNLPSEHERYFVNSVDYTILNNRRTPAAGLHVMKRAISSNEARDAIHRLLQDNRPDIAHLQGIHRHLTPSIIEPLISAGLPIIWTLHDYVALCPNTHFYCRGEVCEACKPGRFYHALLRRCKRDSYLVSLMSTIEAYTHRWMQVYQQVSCFIAPSRFLAHKLEEHRFPSKKVTVLPHFINLEDFKPSSKDEGFALFAGRLTEEKGLRTLIQAKSMLNYGEIYIAGDGPLREELEATVSEQSIPGVYFIGHKSREEVRDLASRARCLLLPSIWYENFPFAVMEAYALGKPIVASRIGAIPELVSDGEDGLLFTPRNPEDLADKLNLVLSDKGIAHMLGSNARTKAEQEWDPNVHYMHLHALYKSVLDGS